MAEEISAESSAEAKTSGAKGNEEEAQDMPATFIPKDPEPG